MFLSNPKFSTGVCLSRSVPAISNLCWDEMVGYVMVIYDYDIPEYDIWHMMIDASKQGRVTGSTALKSHGIHFLPTAYQSLPCKEIFRKKCLINLGKNMVQIRLQFFHVKDL